MPGSVSVETPAQRMYVCVCVSLSLSRSLFVNIYNMSYVY